MTLSLISSFTVIAALVVMFAMFDTANAQRRWEVRGRGLNKARVKLIVTRVEDGVDNFVRNVDRSLDRSRLDGTNREDRLNTRARDLETAMDELARELKRRDAWVQNR